MLVIKGHWKCTRDERGENDHAPRAVAHISKKIGIHLAHQNNCRASIDFKRERLCGARLWIRGSPREHVISRVSKTKPSTTPPAPWEIVGIIGSSPLGLPLPLSVNILPAISQPSKLYRRHSLSRHLKLALQILPPDRRTSESLAAFWQRERKFSSDLKARLVIGEEATFFFLSLLWLGRSLH